MQQPTTPCPNATIQQLIDVKEVQQHNYKDDTKQNL